MPERIGTHINHYMKSHINNKEYVTVDVGDEFLYRGKDVCRVIDKNDTHILFQDILTEQKTARGGHQIEKNWMITK